MTPAQKRRIVEAIKTEMAAKGISQNTWASQHGIARSSMTNIMKENNWGKIGERYWTNLLTKVQHIIEKPALYPTTNSHQIKRACKDAKSCNRVVAIAAYTGAGKTTTLKQYASDNENTYYVVCRSTFGLKDLLLQIAGVMGIQAKGGRAIDLEQAIIDELSNSPESLLIIDSVSKLRKEATLQFLGDLCEAIEHKAGIVLAGTEFFEDYMSKMVQRNKRGFREFNRRIYTWLKLSPFKSKKTQEEARVICENHGIMNSTQVNTILKSATCFGSLSNNIHKALKASSN